MSKLDELTESDLEELRAIEQIYCEVKATVVLINAAVGFAEQSGNAALAQEVGRAGFDRIASLLEKSEKRRDGIESARK